MTLRPLVLAAVTSFFVFALAPALQAQDAVVTAAKKIFAEWQDTVVGVSAVAKISLLAEGASDAPLNIPDREQKMETLGTVIDPAGMVVTALSTLDPSRELSNREIRAPGGMMKLEANATLKEVRIVLTDGTDIPAELVMKDVDLDLAFIRAKLTSKEAKGAVFKAVDLTKSARVNVTDDIVSLGRMDEMFNRQAAVMRGQVTALTKKPREFVRVSTASLGCPTFALDGKLVGIAVNRAMKGKPSLTVLLPAADVLEIAEQAKAARPDAGGKPATNK